MKYSVEPEKPKRPAEAIMERLRNMEPVTRLVAEWIGNEARRKAPRGRNRRASGLYGSLNTTLTSDTEISLRSDKPYARIQNEGGVITPGGGKLRAKMLAIPLTEEARRMSEQMPASQSLKDKDLTLIKTKRGTLLLARTFKRPKLARSKKRGKVRRQAPKKPEFLFVLKDRVMLGPNPLPDGYAPRADDPGLRRFWGDQMAKHLTKGTV